MKQSAVAAGRVQRCANKQAEKAPAMQDDLPILYEDNHLLGAVKPFNMPVQQDSTGDSDLLNRLKAYVKDRYGKPGNAFVALVHRLDRPAGGVMMFARTSKAASRLNKAFSTRDVDKRYLCVVHGKPVPIERELTHWLAKDRCQNLVTAYNSARPGTKEAHLSYQVIAVDPPYSLLRVTLHTGRSHQLRCQLSAIGHALYGDHKYGTGSHHQQLALWSETLSVAHPVQQKTVRLYAGPPQHLAPWHLFAELSRADTGAAQS